jgi:hypothetical protein
MAFEDVKAGIGLLIGEMVKRPEDRHELYFELREKFKELRAMGMPVPDDLARFEVELEAEFAANQNP